MDPELLDRLPLPNLKIYTILSVLAASSSIYYIWEGSEAAFKDLADNRSVSINNADSIVGVTVNTLGKLNYPNSDSAFSGDETHRNPDVFELAHYFIRDWWSLKDVEAGQRNVTETDCFIEGYQEFTWQLVQWASQQPHCVWPLVNLVYCCLILFSHTIQQSVFGDLRSSEQESIKDQFWNLVFYKVVFVFGVVNVQEVEDAVGWCFFVSAIGFLQLARQLCKERHNYLIMMDDMTKNGEARRHKILGLLTFIFGMSICLFLAVFTWFMNSAPTETTQDFLDFRYIVPFTKPYEVESPDTSLGYDFNLGLHSAIFMLSEIGLLVIQSFHALTMCIFDQMYFRHKSSKWNPVSIFSRGAPSADNDEDLYLCISQDINYRFEITSLMFDLVHHVHMLVCCNLFLSMTSLIVSLQMRMRVRQVHAVLKRRQSFTWLNEHIDGYAEVQLDESEHSENCAICWDSLSSHKSKILPCNHCFHMTCLRKWLLVSMHCPTCRMSLLSEEEAQRRREREPRRVYQPRPAVGIMGLLQTGQTLLDLFGGWDPLPDDYNEGQTIPNNVPMFTDFSVQDWPVQAQQDVTLEQPNQDGSTRKD